MIQVYPPEFISKMKDFAVIGLSPAQIAERMKLSGIERKRFLEHITDEDHPLHKEYICSARHHSDDMDAALNTAAIKGDAKALRLNYELEHQDKVDDLKRKLFGI